MDPEIIPFGWGLFREEAEEVRTRDLAHFPLHLMLLNIKRLTCFVMKMWCHQGIGWSWIMCPIWWGCFAWSWLREWPDYQDIAVEKECLDRINEEVKMSFLLLLTAKVMNLYLNSPKWKQEMWKYIHKFHKDWTNPWRKITSWETSQILRSFYFS